MKKSDLKTGMVVETRNGNKYLVLLDNPDAPNMNLINFKGGFLQLAFYDEDMIIQSAGRAYDIMSVYTLQDSIYNLFKERRLRYKLLWERDEPKEMTIAEIEEVLGYKIKIVGDNNI